jgi:hypothetical protein
MTQQGKLLGGDGPPLLFESSGRMERGPYTRRCAITEAEFRLCEDGEAMRRLENSRFVRAKIRRDQPIECEYFWFEETYRYTQLIRQPAGNG